MTLLQPDKASKSRFYYGYAVVLANFFIIMLTWGTAYCFGVFLKPMVAEFGWTIAMASGAYSVFFFDNGLLGIVAGRLTDRFGPRIVMTVCGLFLGAGYLLVSQVNAAWQLYLCYGALIAVGASGAFVPSLATVSRWFVKRRGMMTGVVLTGISTGTIIVPPLARWLISSYGWRDAYSILGLTVLILIVLTAQLMKRDPGQMGLQPYGASETGESPDLGISGLSLRQATRTWQFWTLSAAFVCSRASIQFVLVHIVAHSIEIGVSAAIAVSVLTTVGALGIVGRVAMGSLADRIGNKRALTISFVLMSLALMWAIPARELWTLYLFAGVFGFGYGGSATLMSPTGAGLFGQRSLGVILGIINFVGNIGGTIGPVLAGRIFDVFGSYQLAFSIYAALCVVSIALAMVLKPIQAHSTGSK